MLANDMPDWTKGRTVKCNAEFAIQLEKGQVEP